MRAPKNFRPVMAKSERLNTVATTKG
jgi:hypothetical protein